MRLFFAGAILTMAGLAGWALWRGTDDGPREGAGLWRKAAPAVTAGRPAEGNRTVIPEAMKRGPLPRPNAARDGAATSEAALKQKARELVKTRGETPRAVARKQALGNGFRAVIEHRAPLNATREFFLKTQVADLMPQPGGDPEEQKEAVRKKVSVMEEQLKGMEEVWDEYRIEQIEWYKEEREYAEAAALEDLRRAGGELPAETEEDAAAGRVQEQARWKGMLDAMAAGDETAVTEAARELLRGSASTAAFAMAALAIQDDDWEEAQIWVNQAAAEGDATENETLGNALRGMGWMEADGMRVTGPP